MIEQSIALVLLGGGLTLVGNAIVQAIKNRGDAATAAMNARAKLEEHWTDTTLELVDALRTELTSARDELAELRPLIVRLAHFEEALDHIHALLAALRSGSEIEVAASERRARAFLNRMRGDDAKGEMRQAVQTAISAARIVEDSAKGGKAS